jgi:hypothetical protein
MAAEARGTRVEHEQELKRVSGARSAGRSRGAAWITAGLAAAALLGYLWYDKPAPPQPPPAFGEPLKLRLERQLRN